MKKKLLAGVLAIAIAALAGMGTAVVSAQQDAPRWSIVAHFRYVDGTEYDYVVARGVPTSQMPSMLQACGRSHQGGPAVWFHCYPVPE